MAASSELKKFEAFPDDLIDESEEDILQDECGLFGCLAMGEWPTNIDVAHIIYLGLIALQHRGQESAGIVTGKGDNGRFNYHRGQGLVSHAFREDDLKKLNGNLGLGHTRYSTAGGVDHHNTQPFVVHTAHGPMASAHNGELVNAGALRKMLLKRIGLSTGSDSEILTQILCQPLNGGEPNGPNWPERIRHLMKMTSLSYSLLLMFEDTIYAARDPYGNRPLCIGQLVNPLSQHAAVPDIDGWVISSESCAFPSVSAKLIREIEPGEIVRITKEGIERICIVSRPPAELPALCIFEYVYFARPDSIIEGQMVYSVRIECGRQLAREAPLNADIVSCVPESSVPAALGFSRESGIEFAEVLCKNRYVGRTFIQPGARLRQLSVAKKFGPLSDNFFGKKVVLIDDSIVRGTTIRAIITMLKKNGAKEVHIRIASPPLYHPCYMGINIPTKEELVANKLDSNSLAEAIGADSLVYLSVEGLKKAVRKNNFSTNPIGHCTACLTGEYPVEIEW